MLPAVAVFAVGLRRYVLTDGWRIPGGSGQLRQVSGDEAVALLTRAIASPEQRALRAAYLRLTGGPSASGLLDGAIVGWFAQRLRQGASGGRFALLELRDGQAVGTPSHDSSPQAEEARRLDRWIAELGSTDLHHRGHGYRLVRQGARQRGVSRDAFEALSEAELRSVLAEMMMEPAHPLAQREVLAELLKAVVAAPPGSSPLLLLRRQRHYTQPSAAPAVTPSALRRTLHFIALEAVDEKETPVPGVKVEFVLADGSTRQLATNEEGMARVEAVPAGSTLMRVLNRDGKMWRGVGGAGAQPAAKQGASRSHKVKQGECLSKIALSYGIADWKSVWEHADNAALRKKRKSPHVLLPGDELAIPPMALHELTRDTDAIHRIEVKAAANTVQLRATFRDSKGKGFGGDPYEVRWGGDEEPKLKGSLGGGGLLDIKVPAHLARVEVLLPKRRAHYRLAVSHLDPALDENDTVVMTGAEARLAALGYLQRRPRKHESSRDAVAAFQRDVLEQETPTGTLDLSTCEKLEESYGT